MDLRGEARVRVIADLRDGVPGVSDQTNRLVLAALRAEGRAQPTGTGRSATWRRLAGTAPDVGANR